MTIREAVENVVAAAALKGQITSDPQRLIDGIVRWIEQPNFYHTPKDFSGVFAGATAIAIYYRIGQMDVEDNHKAAQEVLLADNQANI